MDKQETVREVAEVALAELEKLQLRRVQPAATAEIIREVFKGMVDPQPAQENIIPAPISLPTVVPTFPRLLVSYGQAKTEFAIVNSYTDWLPLHSWYTIFPPQQPASRPITTSLEEEVEKLKADGVPERLYSEHERRKASNGFTK